MKKFLSNLKFAIGMLLILAVAAGLSYLMITMSYRAKEAEYRDALAAGHAYLTAENYESAIDAFETAYLNTPSDEAAMGLAKAWYGSGDTEQAITVLANRMGLYTPTDAMNELLIEYKESIGIYEKILIGGKEISADTTAIYLNNTSLTPEDLEKLSEFTEMVTFEADNCGLTDISFLANCTKLMSVRLNDNPITDITPLHNKPELRTVHIANTDITEFTQLYALTSASFIDLNCIWITQDQRIGITNALPNCHVFIGSDYLILPMQLGGVDFQSDVLDLDLSGKNIMDTGSLAGCTQIQALNLSNNRISWISGLDKLTTLTQLNLNGNRLSNIKALATLTKLQKLLLNENSVTDISALASMPELMEVDLGGNPIYHGHSALTSLTKLQKLNLQDSMLKDAHLQLIAMDSMTELDLRGNKQLTQAAVTDFVSRHPNCTIYHDFTA